MPGLSIPGAFVIRSCLNDYGKSVPRVMPKPDFIFGMRHTTFANYECQEEYRNYFNESWIPGFDGSS